MTIFIFAALALMQAQSKTHPHHMGDLTGPTKPFPSLSKYGISYVGLFTPEETKEVDEQIARTADLTERYKEGKVQEVYLLGREYFDEYQKQKPICSTSELNWNQFGQIYGRAALRIGRIEEALKAFQWTGVACQGRDDYGMTHALQGLIDLKHGDLAGAKNEVVNFEGFIGNPHIGMPAPLPTDKEGATALCYLGIDRFAGVYRDFALGAQYDALAVKSEPENIFALDEYGGNLWATGHFEQCVTVLRHGISLSTGVAKFNVGQHLNNILLAHQEIEAQKKLGTKPKTGGVKP